MTPLSAETQQFIRDHANDDVRVLALQAKKYQMIDMHAALTQIAGRQAARSKIPQWYANAEIWYPAHLSMEQCSSEITARYKATLMKGDRLADLTGGLGVDCAFLSEHFKVTTYIERQGELCDIAMHNFAALGLKHITVNCMDSVEALRALDEVDCLFVDPARRDSKGGKTVLISDCEPDVEKLEPLLLEKAKRVMIKLSPMLDLSQALRGLPHTTEVHIVSVHNECKELLLILERGNMQNSADIPIRCVNFMSHAPQNFTFTFSEEGGASPVYTTEVASYLYEPNASLLKAGAFRTVAARSGLKKLHPNSHLYTSDCLVNDFPGRIFRINRSSNNLKEILKGISKAHIATRNFPLSAPELRKRTKLADGGDTYLFATTMNNGKKGYVLGERVEIK